MKDTRITRHSLRTAIGLSLTVCSYLFSLNAAAANVESAADLLGFQRIGNTLEFTVISTGCTNESHFRIDTSTTENDVNATVGENNMQIITLTLIRTKTDNCKRMPGPRVISLNIPDQYTSKTAILIGNAFVALRPRG